MSCLIRVPVLQLVHIGYDTQDGDKGVMKYVGGRKEEGRFVMNEEQGDDPSQLKFVDGLSVNERRLQNRS